MKNTTLENLITSIDASEAKVVTKPVEHLVAEAQQFYQILDSNKADFMARGLSDEFLSLGQAIATELQEREEKWIARRFDEPEVVEQWRTREARGYELLGQLMADVSLGLLGNKKGQRSLEEVKEGSGTADMLLDIGQVVTIGRTYAEDMEACGLDAAYFDAAYNEGNELLALCYSAKVAEGESEELKEARDRAKAFTADYLSLIRTYADVVYRTDPEKRALFVSEYSRDKNKSYRDTQKGETEVN